MAEATQAGTRRPTAQARGTAVAERVEALRAQAHDDPAGAREQAWSWIEELGRRAASERSGALGELQELFSSGRPAEGIRGQTEGIFVTWTLHPTVDRLLGSAMKLWMPWLGKRFDPVEKRGENTLTSGARWPVRLVWPLYSTRTSPLGRAAFEFTTYVEAGLLDPAVDVLVIDYASVSSNPRFVIRQIRDELVQIVPGANLGKMLVTVPGRPKPVLGLYFALKSEI